MAGKLNENLVKLIEESGWKNVKKNVKYMDYSFDIVGERKFTLTKWNILFIFADKITKANMSRYTDVFRNISNKSKSWVWGKCFLLCIVAKSIDPAILKETAADSFGLFGVFRMKGGGGNSFLVDLSKKKIYGKIPSLPYDVHKFSGDLIEILKKVLK